MWTFSSSTTLSRIPTTPISFGPLFARLARDLVSLIEARDANGYVFRTDLRLRPDPAATPPAIALPAALDLLRGHGPELGTRRDDQGAPDRRRSCARRALPRRDPALRLAPPSRFRGDRRHRRDEAADRRAQGHRARPRRRSGRARRSATTSSSARAASARSSFWRRRCNWSGAGAIRACASRPRSGRCGCWCAPGGCRGRPRRRSRRPTTSCAASSTGCRWSPTGRPTPCPPPPPSSPGSRPSWAIAERRGLRARPAAPSRPGAGALRPSVRAGALAAVPRAVARPQRPGRAAAGNRAGNPRAGVSRHRACHRGGARLARRTAAGAALGAGAAAARRSAARDPGRARPPAPARGGVRPLRRVSVAPARRRAAALAVPPQPRPDRPGGDGAGRRTVARRPSGERAGGAGGAARAGAGGAA